MILTVLYIRPTAYPVLTFLSLILRFIELLADHPFFQIHALGASHRSAGKPYASAVKWKLSIPLPEHVGKMIVKECKVDQEMSECGVVFSGLDHDVAGHVGECILL